MAVHIAESAAPTDGAMAFSFCECPYCCQSKGNVVFPLLPSKKRGIFFIRVAKTRLLRPRVSAADFK